MPLDTTINRESIPDVPADSFRAQVDDILTANGDGRQGWEFKHCREEGLGFVGHCYKCGPQFWHPRSCDLRICPDCAQARAQALIDRYSKSLPAIIGSMPASWRLRHLVLTTDICLLDYIEVLARPSILDREKLQELGRLVSNLRVRVRECLQQFFGYDKRVGGLIGAEFGSAGLRLHFHVALLSPYVNLRDLSSQWNAFNGGHGSVVYIVPYEEDQSSLEGMVGYVVKEVASGFTTKANPRGETRSTIEASSRVMALGEALVAASVYYVLMGTRRVQSFGSLYNVPSPDQPSCACPVCDGAIWWEEELTYLARSSAGDLLNLKIGNKLPEDRAPPSGEPARQFELLATGPRSY